MRTRPNPRSALLTASEVARLFRVDPKTVANWARQGKLTGFQTPGGWWRFPEDKIRALLVDAPTMRPGVRF